MSTTHTPTLYDIPRDVMLTCYEAVQRSAWHEDHVEQLARFRDAIAAMQLAERCQRYAFQMAMLYEMRVGVRREIARVEQEFPRRRLDYLNRLRHADAVLTPLLPADPLEDEDGCFKGFLVGAGLLIGFALLAIGLSAVLG
jgi:hypothetical protein